MTLAAATLAAAPAAAGPDLICGDIHGAAVWAPVGDTRAYSLGNTKCNIGDAEAAYFTGTAQHPVLAQNLYRIAGGRLQQIGMAWAFHEFCALQAALCAECEPAGGGCQSRLGVGCSTTDSQSFAGTQSQLGPRSQVNAFTGAFPFPFTAVPAADTTSRRLQVSSADVNPASNPGAVYLAEVQIVAADDAGAGVAHNNASYRPVVFGSGGASVAMSGPVQRQRPAIEGWRDLDPAVVLSATTVPGEGRLTLGCRVVDNGDGTWTYNYALHNLNSHRAVGSLRIPLGCGATATGIGFGAPRSHSGEPYSNAPWVGAAAPDAVDWATQPHAENPSANAVRWGTTYSFWFTTDTPPRTAGAGAPVAGLFLPGDVGSVEFPGIPVPSPACRADWDGAGGVNSADISGYLAAWLADLTGGGADADTDCNGLVNSSDVSAFLTSWIGAVSGTGC